MNFIIEFLLVLFYTAVFIYIMNKRSFFHMEGIKNYVLNAVFVLKVILGVSLALIYTYYYPDRLKADVFKYFDDGRVMFEALLVRPKDFLQMLFGIQNDSPYFDNYYMQMNNWYREYETNIYNDSHTIIRFNALVHIFSFGYFNVHTVFMVFVALCGQTALFRFFRNLTTVNPWLIFSAVFLSPSVLFWSSGVLKEGMLFFGMGFLLYYSYRLSQRFSLYSLLWLIFSVLLLSYLKFYIFISLLPLLFALFWNKKTAHKKPLLKYAVAVFLFILTSLYFHRLVPAYNLAEMMVAKQNDFYHLSIDQESGSLIHLNKLEPTFLSIVKNSPKAIFNVFFLPHLFSIHSIWTLFAAIENAIYLVLLIVTTCFFSYRKSSLSILLFCGLFTLFTFALIGLITPVTGAIVRYKIPALPFLIMTFFLLIDTEKVVSVLSKLNSKLFNR